MSDIPNGFMGHSPTLKVWQGEVLAIGFGMASIFFFVNYCSIPALTPIPMKEKEQIADLTVEFEPKVGTYPKPNGGFLK